MPMLLTLWGRAVERFLQEEEVTWHKMILILDLGLFGEDQPEFLIIIVRATRMLLANGIDPDLLQTTTQTRKALEWLFQETAIRSTKAAVRNALTVLLTSPNLN